MVCYIKTGDPGSTDFLMAAVFDESVPPHNLLCHGRIHTCVASCLPLPKKSVRVIEI